MARIHHRHRDRFLKKIGYVCQVCKVRPAIEVHHKKPQWKGGSSHDDNLQGTCEDCHKVYRRIPVPKYACLFCKDTGFIEQCRVRHPCTRCNSHGK